MDAKQNETERSAFRCAACGDIADMTADLARDGMPIWGLRDDGGRWGGYGLCGDLHRWVPAHKDAV